MPRIQLLKSSPVLDIGFILLTLAFFAVAFGYVAACDRLMK